MIDAEIASLAIAKLSLKPGDLVILKCRMDLRAEQYEHMRTFMEAVLPEGVRCVVLGPELELSVLSDTGDLIHPDDDEPYK